MDTIKSILTELEDDIGAKIDEKVEYAIEAVVRDGDDYDAMYNVLNDEFRDVEQVVRDLLRETEFRVQVGMQEFQERVEDKLYE